MKPQKLFLIAFVIFLVVAGFVLPNTLRADEKKIVVVEKSTNPDDKTDPDNKNNLPADDATAVEAEDLEDAVTKILGQLGEGDCIKELHFRGHGSSGNQSVGDGINHRVGERIDGHQAEWGEKLAPLKSKLCPNATIKLWGCNAGSCDKGAAKLKELADFFGGSVTVKGAVNKVYAGEQNEYTGPMQEATPDAAQPDCIEAAEEKAKKKPCDQQGEIGVQPTTPLSDIVPPESLVISTSQVVSYYESILLPDSTYAHPDLISLVATIVIDSSVVPNEYLFTILELEQTFESFVILGQSTGLNIATIDTSAGVSSCGAINLQTGKILGSARVKIVNDLIGPTGIIVDNFVTGTWDPIANLVTLSFCGPSIAIHPIPTLTEWGLIIFGVVLLGFITWVFFRRRRAVVSVQ